MIETTRKGNGSGYTITHGVSIFRYTRNDFGTKRSFLMTREYEG